MPWVMIVDSSATIGFFPARAPATSGDKSKRSAALIAVLFLRGRTRLSAPDYRQSPAAINGGALSRRSPAQISIALNRHCEEYSDEAIQGIVGRLRLWRAVPTRNDGESERLRFSMGLRCAESALPSRRKCGRNPKSMNDKPENASAAQPDLAAAIRQARVENAERAEAIADLYELEIGRLRCSRARLSPSSNRRRRASTCSIWRWRRATIRVFSST